MNRQTVINQAKRLIREKLQESEPPERMFWLDVDGPAPKGFSGMIIEFETQDNNTP